MLDRSIVGFFFSDFFAFAFPYLCVNVNDNNFDSNVLGLQNIIVFV